MSAIEAFINWFRDRVADVVAWFLNHPADLAFLAIPVAFALWRFGDISSDAVNMAFIGAMLFLVLPSIFGMHSPRVYSRMAAGSALITIFTAQTAPGMSIYVMSAILILVLISFLSK